LRGWRGAGEHVAIAVPEIGQVHYAHHGAHLGAVPGDDKPGVIPGRALDNVRHAVPELSRCDVSFNHVPTLPWGSDIASGVVSPSPDLPQLRKVDLASCTTCATCESCEVGS